MHTVYYWLALFIGFLIHFIYILKDEDGQSQNAPVKGEHYDVIIGILSSRGHFAAREVLRVGLSKQTTYNKSVLVKFIVGGYPCTIPSLDRVNIYKCEASPFIKPSSHHFYFHSVSNLEEHAEEFVPEGPIGYDFIVNHNITIGDLGIYDHNGDGFKGSLKVLLYETPTQKMILSTTFLPFGVRGTSHGLHLYKHGTSVLLPKGFRGSIVVEGSSTRDPLIKTNNCLSDDGGGLITFVRGFRYGREENTFPEFINNHIESYTGATFVYSSHAVSMETNGSMLSHQRSGRYDELRRELTKEKEILQVEQDEYNDLVFVDVVETYRNLPDKMLLFYKWLHYQSFDYLMKTDDDCYINMTGISHFLCEIHPVDKVWIGRFRTNFLVNLYGKWEEHDYKSLTYPPFACGSGYLLSADIVQWIFVNRFYLKSYQGEDVSLGIWLSAINLTFINYHRFQCIGGHYNDVFSSPDNNLSTLQQLYGVNN